MRDSLYGLTSEDAEWPAALDLATHLFVYNRGKNAKHFWDRAFLADSLDIKQPTLKFQKGLHAQGLEVNKTVQNLAAVHEYAHSLGTTFTPPEEKVVWYRIHFSGQLPDTPVMPSGPMYHYTPIS